MEQGFLAPAGVGGGAAPAAGLGAPAPVVAVVGAAGPVAGRGALVPVARGAPAASSGRRAVKQLERAADREDCRVASLRSTTGQR